MGLGEREMEEGAGGDFEWHVHIVRIYSHVENVVSFVFPVLHGSLQYSMHEASLTMVMSVEECFLYSVYIYKCKNH